MPDRRDEASLLTAEPAHILVSGLLLRAFGCSLQRGLAARRRLRRQLHDQAICQAHVDGSDVARQKPVARGPASTSSASACVLAVFRQLDGDAVVEPQIPAPIGDADIALDPAARARDSCRSWPRSPARLVRRAVADDQRQQAHDLPPRTARSPLPSCSIERELVAMLPDARRPRAPRAHFERIADRPCAPRQPRPRAASAMRSRAASTSKPISEVQPSSPSLSRMSISDVSRLPDTLTWSTAKPVRAVTPCTMPSAWPPR